MLKTAYQFGLLKAFKDENIEKLLKEATELGIDLEKASAFGGVSNLLSRGLQAGRKAVSGMSPLQKNIGIGAAGLGAGGLLGRATAPTPEPPPPNMQQRLFG
jgi:hypothetical protein